MVLVPSQTLLATIVVALCLCVAIQADPKAEASFLFPLRQDHRRAADGVCSWSLVSGGSPCSNLAGSPGAETEIVVDGQCNFNTKLGYYMAVCAGTNSDSAVKFLRAHCEKPDCSSCHEFVPGCDVGAGECGFLSRNEQRDPSACSERRDPRTNSLETAYGLIGTCANTQCATRAQAPLPPEPCSWRMRNATTCKEFNSNGVSAEEIIADGKCRYHDQVGWHIAVCTERAKLAFRRAHCVNSDCTGCNEFRTKRKCKYEEGECGSVSRNFEYVSGKCFQIVDLDDEKIFGYDFIGTCKNPTCAYTTTAIQPTVAPSKQPSPATPQPTPATPRPTIATAYPIPQLPSPNESGTNVDPVPPPPPPPQQETPPPTPFIVTPLPATPIPTTPKPSAAPTSASPTSAPTLRTPSASPTSSLEATQQLVEDEESSARTTMSAIGWTTTAFTLILTLCWV